MPIRLIPPITFVTSRLKVLNSRSFNITSGNDSSRSGRLQSRVTMVISLARAFVTAFPAVV